MAQISIAGRYKFYWPSAVFSFFKFMHAYRNREENVHKIVN